MTPASWNEIATLVSAGSVLGIEINDDLDTLLLDIGYANIRDHTTTEARISLVCSDCSYINISRLEHHEPGSGAIWDAYIHDQSDLITALLSHQLDGKSGNLLIPSASCNASLRHLEIVGEVSINVICADIACYLSQLLQK